MLARVIALTFALAAPAAFAGTTAPPPAAASASPTSSAPRLDRKEQKLERHIEKAQAKGRITPAQAQALQQKIAAIRAQERQMAADGLTKDEKKALKKQLVDVKNELKSDSKR